MAVSDELEQLPLAQYRVGQVQPVKLDLLRMMDSELFEEPIVQRTMVLELQRADGVRDTLD